MTAICRAVDIYISIHPGTTLKEALSKMGYTLKTYEHSKKVLARHKIYGKYGSSNVIKEHRCSICKVLCSDIDSLYTHMKFCDGMNRYKNTDPVIRKPRVIQPEQLPGIEFNISSGDVYSQNKPLLV